VLEELARGLYEGARQAQITIPGGEIAQVAEMIRGADRGEHFDLVGTAVGIVDLNKILIGADIRVGDQVIGIMSSGLHSNGFTLVRKALLERAKLSLDTYVPELGRTIGEALLEPTLIYVRAIMDILSEESGIGALVNITGGGFLNLLRTQQPATFELNKLPVPPPIFSLLQTGGSISDEEMHTVFNMGIGFCIVCREEAARRVEETVNKHGFEAACIGTVIDTQTARVTIPRLKLMGQGQEFRHF
jgi:phosphoribosylformylglycinamidine cyclo-ligase